MDYRIHYICAYAEQYWLDKYLLAPSGSAKINYIRSAIREAGWNISMFSPVCVKYSFASSKLVKIDEHENHYYPFSIGGNNRFVRLTSYFLIYIQLFLYLLLHVKKNEVVLLYHSNPDTKIIKTLSKFLGFKLILELEEIYSAVFHNTSTIETEKHLVSTSAVAYLLVNNIISKKCNITNPSVVCEGQYLSLSNNPKTLLGNNGKINVLYAGVIEKGADVFAAIEAAKLLGPQYALHIAGYGSSEAIKELEVTCANYEKCNYECCVMYYGCLHGDEYEKLLSKCSIGLCSRMLEDELSDYTFPSKVFAYLARNLKVVCTPISCVMASNISSYIVFSEDTTPIAIANAIKSIERNTVIDNSAILQNENNRFVQELKLLFQNLGN